MATTFFKLQCVEQIHASEHLQAALISEVVAYERLESGNPIHHMLYIAIYIKQWSCLLWSRFVIARQNLDYLCM